MALPYRASTQMQHPHDPHTTVHSYHTHCPPRDFIRHTCSPTSSVRFSCAQLSQACQRHRPHPARSTHAHRTTRRSDTMSALAIGSPLPHPPVGNAAANTAPSRQTRGGRSALLAARHPIVASSAPSSRESRIELLEKGPVLVDAPAALAREGDLRLCPLRLLLRDLQTRRDVLLLVDLLQPQLLWLSQRRRLPV